MRITKILIALVILTFGVAGPLWAATATQNVTINATVSARATLSFTGLGSGNSINFVDADPSVTTSIPATENPVTCTCSVRTGSGSHPTLVCKAGGDLTSGTDTIPISKVSWTAASPYQAGTMSKSADQTVSATWTGSGVRTGQMSFFLNNSPPDAWTWATGSYSATVTYTLTAP
jgi:hypothetical protein